MSIYDFKAKKINGEEIELSEYKGKVLLIVNTASKCGFTSQYDGLEAMYKKYKDEGFEILGFPCDQFLHQEPGGSEEISEFCRLNFGVTFQLFEKIDVNGKNEHPLYSFLKKEQGGKFGSKVKWNFTKFLVDREGNVVDRFDPKMEPKAFEKDVKALI